MKKKLSVFFAILFFAVAMMPLFLLCKSDNVAVAAVSESFKEDNLKNKQDIISTSQNAFSNSSATEGNSPFNSSTGNQMEGYTVTPNTDEYGQFGNYYSVDVKNVTESKSIYMWIYIPSTTVYDLELSIRTSDGDYLNWDIASETLYNLIINKVGITSIRGWKLFEFSVNNAEQNISGKALSDCSFVSLYLSYKYPSSELKEKMTETFSFYHIYLADSFYMANVIADYTNFVNYKVKSIFMQSLRNLYIDDSYKIMSSSEIFEYMFVGKKNVILYPDLSLTWNIYISNENGKRYDMKFGNTYTFEEDGYYTIGIEVSETKNSITSTLLHYTDSFYVNKFNFGSMKSEYKYEKGTENVLKFTFSQDFVLNGDVKITISDKSIISESHYIKGNVCYITITGHKTGSARLKITANGNRAGETSQETYEATTIINITQKSSTNLEILILWVTFGVFCTALLIFLVISFVKARKSGVK